MSLKYMVLINIYKFVVPKFFSYKKYEKFSVIT